MVVEHEKRSGTGPGGVKLSVEQFVTETDGERQYFVTTVVGFIVDTFQARSVEAAMRLFMMLSLGISGRLL